MASPAEVLINTSQRRRRWEGWLFLLAFALLIAFVNPIVVDLRPRLDLSLVTLVLGAVLVGTGLTRRMRALTGIGALVLWAGIIVGVGTQITPLRASPGLVWAPRGALLSTALLIWVLILGVPGWFRHGLLALAAVTLATLLALWFTAPAAALNAKLYWLAVNSQGTVYASDSDSTAIWVFNANGSVRGKLWPPHATSVGTHSPGIEPAGITRELLQPPASRTPTPVVFNPFSFCGLALDPQDHLYVAELNTQRLLSFDRDGQVVSSWALPADYLMTWGCLAADRDHVYLADRHNRIYIYNHSGALQGQYALAQTPKGIAAAPEGRLVVLYDNRVETLRYPNGDVADDFALPRPKGELQVPYEVILLRTNGELLVTDLENKHVLRFAPDGQPLPALGAPGRQPGQFNGLAGLAEDQQGRIYVADFTYRVVQRFNPDGQVDAVWSTHEDDTDE